MSLCGGRRKMFSRWGASIPTLVELTSELQYITHCPIVLHYFARSSFFDATSNNAVLTTQATHNAGMAHVIGTREAFEGALRTMQGLEFVVSHDPSENGHKIENSGVWVIRKQTRRKRQGADDELLPISSYFVVGENIYMAPSVLSIISNRMVRTVLNHLGREKFNPRVALGRHISEPNALDCIYVTNFHTLSGPYIPTTRAEERRFCVQYTGEPIKRWKHADPKHTRDQWEQQNSAYY